MGFWIFGLFGERTKRRGDDGRKGLFIYLSMISQKRGDRWKGGRKRGSLVLNTTGTDTITSKPSIIDIAKRDS